jgi:predicted nucleotidyltransferase
MPRNPKTSLPPAVTAEIPKRLHNAAEAFYFAGILSGAPFYGGGSAPNQHYTISCALEGIIKTRYNQLDAPPLVNFAFSIELYIKLLRFLADGRLMEGHNLHDLFLKMEKAATAVATSAIRHHRYARGNREEFIEYLVETKSAFEDWRYAYEKELLVAVPDNFRALADAFRAAIGELHPDRFSVFQALPIPLQILGQWAATKPTIKTLYVFGSYARGEARPSSDLDLAFEFTDQTEALSELLENAAVWRAELTQSTGMTVKDLYLSTDDPAQGGRVEVFSRNSRP